jgi:hypothetical protein
MTVVAMCILPALSPAALISDPAGDFLPTYVGPQNGDLDVLEAEVFFDGSSFLFTSTSNAAIGTTPGGVFVWGINRGAGLRLFPPSLRGSLSIPWSSSFRAAAASPRHWTRR